MCIVGSVELKKMFGRKCRCRSLLSNEHDVEKCKSRGLKASVKAAEEVWCLYGNCEGRETVNSENEAEEMKC